MKKILAVTALSLLLLGAGSTVALAEGDDDADTNDVVCDALDDTDELAARIRLASGLLELSDDDDALLDLGAVLRLVSDDDDIDCDD